MCSAAHGASGSGNCSPFLTNPAVIRKILAWLHLPMDSPTLVPARDSPDGDGTTAC